MGATESGPPRPRSEGRQRPGHRADDEGQRRRRRRRHSTQRGAETRTEGNKKKQRNEHEVGSSGDRSRPGTAGGARAPEHKLLRRVGDSVVLELPSKNDYELVTVRAHRDLNVTVLGVENVGDTPAYMNVYVPHDPHHHQRDSVALRPSSATPAAAVPHSRNADDGKEAVHITRNERRKDGTVAAGTETDAAGSSDPSQNWRYRVRVSPRTVATFALDYRAALHVLLLPEPAEDGAADGPHRGAPRRATTSNDVVGSCVRLYLESWQHSLAQVPRAYFARTPVAQEVYAGLQNTTSEQFKLERPRRVSSRASASASLVRARHTEKDARSGSRLGSQPTSVPAAVPEQDADRSERKRGGPASVAAPDPRTCAVASGDASVPTAVPEQDTDRSERKRGGPASVAAPDPGTCAVASGDASLPTSTPDVRPSGVSASSSVAHAEISSTHPPLPAPPPVPLVLVEPEPRASPPELGPATRVTSARSALSDPNISRTTVIRVLTLLCVHLGRPLNAATAAAAKVGTPTRERATPVGGDQHGAETMPAPATATTAEEKDAPPEPETQSARHNAHTPETTRVPLVPAMGTAAARAAEEENEVAQMRLRTEKALEEMRQAECARADLEARLSKLQQETSACEASLVRARDESERAQATVATLGADIRQLGLQRQEMYQQAEQTHHLRVHEERLLDAQNERRRILADEIRALETAVGERERQKKETTMKKKKKTKTTQRVRQQVAAAGTDVRDPAVDHEAAPASPAVSPGILLDPVAPTPHTVPAADAGELDPSSCVARMEEAKDGGALGVVRERRASAVRSKRTKRPPSPLVSPSLPPPNPEVSKEAPAVREAENGSVADSPYSPEASATTVDTETAREASAGGALDYRAQSQAETPSYAAAIAETHVQSHTSGVPLADDRESRADDGASKADDGVSKADDGESKGDNEKFRASAAGQVSDSDTVVVVVAAAAAAGTVEPTSLQKPAVVAGDDETKSSGTPNEVSRGVCTPPAPAFPSPLSTHAQDAREPTAEADLERDSARWPPSPSSSSASSSASTGLGGDHNRETKHEASPRATATDTTAPAVTGTSAAVASPTLDAHVGTSLGQGFSADDLFYVVEDA